MYLTVIEQQKLCSRVISVICSVISVICSHLIVDNHCHIGNRPIWHHAISVSGGKFVAISGLVISAGSGIVLPTGKQWLIFSALGQKYIFFSCFITNLHFFFQALPTFEIPTFTVTINPLESDEMTFVPGSPPAVSGENQPLLSSGQNNSTSGNNQTGKSNKFYAGNGNNIIIWHHVTFIKHTH